MSEIVPELSQAGEIAIDTEADSYYVYHVKVCLLQLSTRQRDYLIDPLVGLDLSPVGALCADPGIAKVFHAGANDVALLRHHHRFQFANLFDTMLAAQVLGLKRPGLAALLRERFGVEQKKSFQTSDWGRRPLSPGQLQYAAADTHWLLELKDQLKRELVEKARLEEAEEEFDKLRAADHVERGFDPESFRRVEGANALDPVALRVLKELVALRDRIAARRDRSPHRVFSDSALLDIARAQPQRRDELFAVDGIPHWRLEREAQALVETVAAARAKGPLLHERPRRARGFEGEVPLRDEERRVFEALRDWRRARAKERDVDESRVATTGTLRLIAREGELTKERLGRIAGMTPFRVREYGDEILRVIASVRRPAG